MAKQVSKSEFKSAIQPYGLMIEKPSRTEKDGAYLYECFDNPHTGDEIGFISWYQSEATYHIH